MSDTPEQELRNLLGAIRRRWMAASAFGITARAIIVIALVIGGAAAVDRTLEPAGWVLVALWAAVVLCVAVVATLAARQAAKRPTDHQVARFVEERCPELNDLVASATEVQADGGVFAPLLLTAAVQRLRGVEPSRVVGSRALRDTAGRAVAAGIVLALAVGWAWNPARRAWVSARAYLFPYELALEVAPGDAKVVSGQPLAVKALLKAPPELLGRAAATLQFLEESTWRSAPMRRAAERFSYDFPAVTRDFRYRVTVAGVSSREYVVRALRPPAVARIDVHYTYPPFTKLEPRVEEDGGDIYAPAGTKVRVRVNATKRADGSLMMAGGTTVKLRPHAGNVLDGEFTVSEDGAYRVALVDSDGVASPGENEYFIRVVDDRPPNVQILRPEGDRHVTALEEVAIEARADDDYGVERFELVYAVRGGPEKTVALAGTRGTSATGATTLFLEDLKVNPGDFVAYYARARDVGRGKKSVEAQSDIYFLEVKPFEEEFSLAQSQAMAGGGAQNRSLAELAKAQKEIVIATWKYNRRSLAGRSADDIRALGRAQAELKTRATQFARGVSPRGGSGPDGDAVSRATAAMGKAQAALEAVKPSDALPHEMEALNELLKAMAEDRKTQIAQMNQNGGGGGGQQSREDLSALFDRELMRQQQTNYETRQSGSQEEQQRRDDDPLARLRELARRQDDLAKRQRDLAQQQARLSEEERKRELERLTREQSELRQQLEELTRQMSRGQQNAQSPSQSGGASKAGQSASDRMREISEEMQNAASDLRRNDPKGASARSEKALERLREMEQRMRGGQPDERRRVLGEMQLEAQQLADAQRRVANEAQSTAAQGTPDTRRRLAGEKERLAERVDRLERNLREMSQEGGAERQQLSDAARELQRNQVGERMRQSAEAWRKSAETTQGAAKPDPTGRGKPQPAAAGESDATRRAQVQTEQQLADALRRTAERMGAPGTPQDPAARKLAEDLQRTRELRDRLGDLERRMEQMAKSGEPAGQPQTGQTGRDPRQDMTREMENARQMLQRLGRQDPALGPQHMTTPEHHEFSTSAPGTEAFKQDFSRWEALRKNLQTALERAETGLSAKLHEQQNRDRLRAGATERLPEEYRKLVDRYYQALATGSKP